MWSVPNRCRCSCHLFKTHIYANRSETPLLGYQERYGATGVPLVCWGARRLSHSRLPGEWMQNSRGKPTGRVCHCVHNYVMSDCFPMRVLKLTEFALWDKLSHVNNNENEILPEPKNVFLVTKSVISGFFCVKQQGQYDHDMGSGTATSKVRSK